MTKHYEYNKKWRYKNPNKRQEGKKRYYQKSQNVSNKGEPWNVKDIRMVLEHNIPDSELSKVLGRSVQAIQHVRLKYKKIFEDGREINE